MTPPLLSVGAPPAWLPALVFLVYAAVFVGRSLWLRRFRGVRFYVFQSDDPLQRFVEQGFRVVLAGFVLYVVLVLAAPGVAARAGSVPLLQTGWIAWVGVGLQLAGSLAAAAGQVSMGTAWRIGIPWKVRDDRADGRADGTGADGAGAGGDGLVQGGIFHRTRNPVFLGMMAQMAGVVLWSPTALSVLLGTAGWCLIQIQVRQEEAALARRFPDTYPAYAARVRRWV